MLTLRADLAKILRTKLTSRTSCSGAKTLLSNLRSISPSYENTLKSYLLEEQVVATSAFYPL